LYRQLQSCSTGIFNYAIDPVGLSFDIVGGSVEWDMLPVLDDTDQILSNHRQRSGSKKLHDAKQFLREQLEGKPPVDSEEIFRRARQYQIGESRLREAKKELSIDAYKSSFNGKWVWAWPGENTLDRVSIS
jgi:hypothetical protein